jgi:ankyrin repeat protein
LQILRLHPDQVDSPDALGLYPLHYAVRHASRSDVSAYTQFVIEALLERSSEATSVADADGRLPLHIAIANKGTWHKSGVRELVLANPSALRRADPLHGLLPFMASATSAAKSRLHLSTTFELLLAAPDMVMARKGPC